MRRLLAILALTLTASVSSAATITVSPLSNDWAVVYVRGEFRIGDDKEFVNKALPLKDAFVVFASDGGHLMTGIEIGRAIRLKGFLTYVEPGDSCVSACAIAWLGGRKRFISKTSRIGFHAAYLDENGSKTESGTGNALVGAYLAQLGMSQTAIIFVTAAPPDRVAWLNLSNASTFGIEVENFELKDDQSPAKPSAKAAPQQAQSALPSGENAAAITCSLTDRKGNQITYRFVNTGPGVAKETHFSRNGVVKETGSLYTTYRDNVGLRLVYNASPDYQLTLTDKGDVTLTRNGGGVASGTCR